jgi:hypothetical protein
MIDLALVRRAVRRLTAGIEAPNAELADARLDRMTRWGARSPRNTNALFAAVQMLRDLGAIDLAESAYLLNGMFDDIVWRELHDDKTDPDLARAIEDGVDINLVTAAMHEQERARMEAWYRDRGEEDLAAILAKDFEAYTELCVAGQISLIDDKPSREEQKPQRDDTAAAALLAERILALSGSESVADWHRAWKQLCDAMRDVDAATAIPAIQSLRAVGGISFEESFVLVDMVVTDEVSATMDADREYYRLRRELDEVERSLGISYEPGVPDETRPLPWQILNQRLNRRFDGLTAIALRRYGEHRMASLLIDKPDEYQRIRDESRIGAM